MRTARLAQSYDITLRHTLFPLHPETPPEGITLNQLFGGRANVEASQEQMKRLMSAEGLAYGDRTHTYNSRRAQEFAKWAEAQPGGDAVHGALYRAYFVEAKNLADTEVLLSVAAELGLQTTEGEQALEAGEFAEAVDRDWARSRMLGITGVPTFVVGKRGVVGAQPFDVLERLVLDSGGTAKTD